MAIILILYFLFMIKILIYEGEDDPQRAFHQFVLVYQKYNIWLLQNKSYDIQNGTPNKKKNSIDCGTIY